MKETKKMDGFISLQELERQALERLPKPVYDFYAGGADDEVTLADNTTRFRSIKLKNRVLVDVSKIDLSTTVLGQEIALPVLVAPMAFQGLAHPEGERATASASGETGTIMIASTVSSVPHAEISAHTPIPPWFQLYVYKDRAITSNLVSIAKEAGYRALVVTVDVPVYGKRERELSSSFKLPQQFRLNHLIDAGVKISPGEKDVARHLTSLLDPSLTWKDIQWLRSISPLPIVLKGILNKEDAVIAAEHGVSAVIVSNHGGRQLDTAPAAIEVLPEITGAINQRLTILMDGGIRRGTDIIKAVALGADAVLIGRPVLWGLALQGKQGVVNVLKTLTSELTRAMALCGCTSIKNITRDVIWPPVKKE